MSQATMQEIFREAAQLESGMLDRAGGVESFVLGCEIGGLAVIMLAASRKGGEVKVSIPCELRDQARLIGAKLGSCAFNVLAVVDEPGRIQIEVRFF